MVIMGMVKMVTGNDNGDRWHGEMVTYKGDDANGDWWYGDNGKCQWLW